MKLREAIAFALGASLALTAHAQTNEKFKSLDRDGDGFLSKEETSRIRGYAQAFDEADDNRDGKLNADEFVKAEALHDRLQAGAYVSDSVLTAKVKTALIRERGLKSTDVNVETYRGRVLLSGWVENEEQRKHALRVVSKVEGVVEVRDGMNVR